MEVRRTEKTLNNFLLTEYKRNLTAELLLNSHPGKMKIPVLAFKIRFYPSKNQLEVCCTKKTLNNFLLSGY